MRKSNPSFAVYRSLFDYGSGIREFLIQLYSYVSWLILDENRSKSIVFLLFPYQKTPEEFPSNSRDPRNFENNSFFYISLWRYSTK
jgi:hypothetical protein